MYRMNQRSLACLLLLGLFLTGLSACRSEAPRPAVTPTAEVTLGPDRYVLMTYRKTIIPSGPMRGRSILESYISYFTQMPQGEGINNILEENTLFGRFGEDGGGLLQSGEHLYRFSNAVNNLSQGDLLVNTPVRLVFSSTPRAIGERALLESESGGFSQAAKNFVVTSEQGFLVQPSYQRDLLSIRSFDPETMEKTSPQIYVSNLDKERIRQFILERTPSLAGQELPNLIVGMKLLAVHGSALILDVELQSPSYANLSRDSYLVAYEAKNGGKLLGLSHLENTGRLGTPSELLQYTTDEEGDLYLLAQGGDQLGFYQNSLLYRIRKGSYTIDPDWQVRISDLGLGYPARFNGIFARGGKLFTLVNVQPLPAVRSQIPENLWQYYTIDLQTREAKPLSALRPSSAFQQGVNIAAFVDGHLYLRYVRTGEDAPYNGYWSYDLVTGEVKPAFSVSLQSGYVADFKKITLPKR